MSEEIAARYAEQEQEDRRRISAIHIAMQIVGTPTESVPRILDTTREVLAFLRGELK